MNRQTFRGAGAALVLAAAASAAAAAPPPPVIEHERDGAQREPPPHGEVGMSVVHRFFEGVKERGFVLRKRTYLPGSAVGRHVITRDQFVLVLDGEGEYVTHGQPHPLRPGLAVYAYDDTPIAIRPTGGSALSLLMAWSRAEVPVPDAYVVVDRDVAHLEPAPVGEQGRSVNYRLFLGEPGRMLEFRRRTLEVGAAVGSHVVANDQAYYVLQGAGEMRVNGRVHRLEAGMAAYVYDSSTLAIRQTGREPLSYILTFPYAGKPPTPPAVVVDGSRIAREEPPHGGVGLSTAWRYTDGIDRRTLEVRRRRLHAAAVQGDHVLNHEQAFYIHGGRGVIVVDGTAHAVEPGHAIYAAAGSRVSLRPLPGATLDFVIVWPVSAASSPRR